MSAWIVDRAHIDVLVQGLCESETVVADPCEVGRALWRENLRSVAYRYPGDKDGDRPGPVSFQDSDVDTYSYRRPARRISQDELVDAIDCYVYQSCEHDGWALSAPRSWMALLRTRLLQAGAKDGRGPWGFSEEEVHGTTA